MTLQEFAATGDQNQMHHPYADSNAYTTAAAVHARLGVLQGRRRITREDGRALERISHAADYLLDSYANSGSDNETLHGQSPEMDAIHILVRARNRVLESLPVVEPIHKRVWQIVAGRNMSSRKSVAAGFPVALK